MTRRIVTAIAISASLLLAGCNTVRGAGEDIKSVADAGDRVI